MDTLLPAAVALGCSLILVIACAAWVLSPARQPRP